jgi:hypothetical protein
MDLCQEESTDSSEIIAFHGLLNYDYLFCVHVSSEQILQ